MEYGHVTSLLNRFLIKYCAVKFIVTERRKDQREIGCISNICQYFSSIGFRFYKKRLIKYIWEITLCKEVTHIYHRAYQMIASPDMCPSLLKLSISYWTWWEQRLTLCIAVYSVSPLTYDL